MRHEGGGAARLVAITALVMVAFAANSILNRAAVGGGHAGPLDFAALRVLSGAAMLGLLAARRGGAGWLRAMRAVNVAALTVYLLAFSLAYLALPAGAGALILFAAVQVTMFGGAVAGAEAIPARRWIGAGLALSGLAWMLLPGTGGLDPGAGALMALAGAGWGVYSLRGRAGGAPLDTTAASFLGAAPFCALAWAMLPGAASGPDAAGIALALVSGGVTSGLGYALWYAIVPDLGATRAAVAQLSVPVIAVVAGVILLGEAVTWRLALSCLLVLGGIGLGLAPRRRG